MALVRVKVIMAKTAVILGSQWGDEGKGKIVDLLTEKAQWVIRFQGGHNAGHTLVIDGNKFILRLIPSGILHEGVICVLGQGVVISPSALCEEIALLEKKGISFHNRLLISHASALVLPYHVALDQARERAQGDKAVGTTGRGIGPAYEDKVGRRALRVVDLLDPQRFVEKLKPVLEYHNFMLTQFYHQPAITLESIMAEIEPARLRLQSLIVDVPPLLAKAYADGATLLFEGAQGALLDVDHGTYPYVTSSNTTAGSAATGSGFGPRNIQAIIGVTKAYCTRVGGGPFPTELHDEVGKHLSRIGQEVGSVTGRPRRCGWFDAVAMRRSAQLNSLTWLAITKLDVMDALSEVKICTAYRYQGKVADTLPISTELLAECEPVYEVWPGWQESTQGLRSWDELPVKAQNYLNRLVELIGVPIAMISTGPDRRDTIMLADILLSQTEKLSDVICN